MSKRQTELNRHLASCVMLGMILAIGAVPATASANVTFTWDPAGASVPLGGAGSALTANGIVGLHYLYDVTPPAGSPMIYPVDFIEHITGFSLNGTPVTTPGSMGRPAHLAPMACT